MPAASSPDSPTPARDPFRWQLPLVLVVSAAYESLFVHHGLNLLDEGWPLYVAKRLHEGGSLYRDAFFVFPPAHALSAWLGYWWEPPGILATRTLYAAFNVALTGCLYLLGRRIMPANFALLGALLLALAAPYSHMAHFLFGYRYLAIAALGLLAFARRLEGGASRWTFAAGACAGIAVCFRLTPAFALGAAVAVGVLAASRDWRRWLRDWGLFGAGAVLASAPVVLWFASSVGFEALWREVVVRPLLMTDLQSKPMPPLEWPLDWERREISRLFTAVQFRVYLVLYAGYVLALGGAWLRALAGRRPFEQALLVTLVVWGGVYFVRTLGRSDIAHLESALPPVCLLLAHLASVVTGAAVSRLPALARRRGMAEAVLCVVVLASWVFLFRTDASLRPSERGGYPLESLQATISLPSDDRAEHIDKAVLDVLRHSRPSDPILDMSRSPLLHVITGRNGVGYRDLLIPGTFLDEAEEREFIERLEATPPAVVMVADTHFDKDPARSIVSVAPLVSSWVRRHYRILDTRGSHIVWVPKERRGSE